MWNVFPFTEAYQIGQQLHGFVVQHVVPVPELQLTAVGLEHVATGAQHLHVDRKDTNNVFWYAWLCTIVSSAERKLQMSSFDLFSIVFVCYIVMIDKFNVATICNLFFFV